MKSTLFRTRTLALLLAASVTSCAATKQTPRKGVTPAATPASQPVDIETGEFTDYAKWPEVATFVNQMIEKHGFSREQLEDVLRKTQYVDRTVQLMKPAPPGKPKNWAAYRARFIEPVRVDAGIAFWNTYQQALARAEREFGVPAEIIVGIIGVETMYGRNTGSFRVMDAIATLAFAYPDTPTRATRMTYFRNELENTLLYARDMDIDPLSLLGSYAGAIGLPQFMPGSILQYAVDFDADHRIDLRGSAVDAIGSVANFLVKHGWQRGRPIAFPVTVEPASGSNEPAWQKFIGRGLKATLDLNELHAGGVTPLEAVPTNLRYGLIDLQNASNPTEYWLATDNFFAITHYNRSYFYAMAVTELGRTINAARNAQSRKN